MEQCLTYRTGVRLNAFCQKYRAAIFVSLCTALLTYMFVLTNKIVNWDDAQFLFGKGYTLTSGRWGLDLLSWIFPDYSMPWLWGSVSILILTFSICLILEIFQVRSKLLQCLLAGLIIAFPSQIGTMFYMFTTTSYAVAFALAVSAVYIIRGGGNTFLALIASIFSLSIYQAYIAITASFLVVLLIQDLLGSEETFASSVGKGIRYVLFLLAALVLYLGITYVLLAFSGEVLNGWATRATEDGNSIFYRLIRSMKLFLAIIFKQTYGIATTKPSVIAHICCLAAVGICVVMELIHMKDWKKSVLVLILGGLMLPMSVNCLVIMLGENGVHTLTMYGFVSVYVLSTVFLESMVRVPGKFKTVILDIAVVSMVVVIVSNVYMANKVYLRQYLENKQAYSFYDSVIANIQETPGFDENSKLLIVGSADSKNNSMKPFEKNMIYGLNGFRAEAISDEMLEYYCGFTMPYASAEEREAALASEEFQNMPSYPYYGYVQKIDNCIVVKLSDPS